MRFLLIIIDKIKNFYKDDVNTYNLNTFIYKYNIYFFFDIRKYNYF